MEGGEHGIDRIERPIDPSGLDIFRAFSEARVNIYGGSLGSTLAIFLETSYQGKWQQMRALLKGNRVVFQNC
jgi:hypothetical protein